MTYPTSTDYVNAVQNPQALQDENLRRARFDLHPLWGIPTPASGNSAVVFKAELDSNPCAFRFFIREDVSSRDRYHSLHAFLENHQLNDCAAAEWVDDAILVNNQPWPMVRMQWIEGRALDAYVEYLADAADTSALASLAEAWRDLIRRMQEAGFAHGDLQHGNVLVDTSARLKLVDFDGSWVAGTNDPPPAESGHPNYQLRGRAWGRWMDTFPGLLVYTALCGLAVQPDLWVKFKGKENILFTKDDFLSPGSTAIWRELSSLGDPQVSQGLSQLRAACAAPSALEVPLQSALDGSTTPPQPSATPPKSAPRPNASFTWWQAAAAGQSIGQAQAGDGSPLPPPPPKPPPPKTISETPTGAFSAGGSPQNWFQQASPGPSYIAAGTGPGGGSGPPRAPGANRGSPSARGPAGNRRTPTKRRRTGLWVTLAALITVAVVAVLIAHNSGPDPYAPYPYPDASDSPQYSSSAGEPSSSEPTDLQSVLLQHVPGDLSSDCSALTPSGAAAVADAAVTCTDSATSISFEYYMFASKDDMDHAFHHDYFSQESGTCVDGQEGSGTLVNKKSGDETGSYSCYQAKNGDTAWSWTNDATLIMGVAWESGSTYQSLGNWVLANAGPY